MAFGLWEQDPLDAGDYVVRQSRSAVSPEGRLMLAVLKHALFEYEKLARRRGPKPDELRKLERWFFAGEEAEAWPFAFENLCALLELNPDWIRSRLLALAKAPASPCDEPAD